MENTKVIVDTCFLSKLSSEWKEVKNIRLVLDELGLTPVVHSYVAKNELLDSRIQDLIKSGYIEVVEYDSFLIDEEDKEYYCGLFETMYEDLRQYLVAINSRKQMKTFDSFRVPVLDYGFRGINVGDVHMFLMSIFLNMPMILTDDSDLEVLKVLAEKRRSIGNLRMEIWDSYDLIKQIAGDCNTTLSKKQLESILDSMGLRGKRTEIREIWAKNHI